MFLTCPSPALLPPLSCLEAASLRRQRQANAGKVQHMGFNTHTSVHKGNGAQAVQFYNASDCQWALAGVLCGWAECCGSIEKARESLITYAHSQLLAQGSALQRRWEGEIASMCLRVCSWAAVC